MLPTRFPAPGRHPPQLQPPIKLEEESETPSTEFNFGSEGTGNLEDGDKWKERGGGERLGWGEDGGEVMGMEREAGKKTTGWKRRGEEKKEGDKARERMGQTQRDKPYFRARCLLAG